MKTFSISFLLVCVAFVNPHEYTQTHALHLLSTNYHHYDYHHQLVSQLPLMKMYGVVLDALCQVRGDDEFDEGSREVPKME